MIYHKSVQQIQNILTSNGIEFQVFEHQPVRTSEEAAKTRPGYTLEQGAKALIIKSNGKYWMFVMPANLRLKNSKVRKAINQKEFRFATPDEVTDITEGVQVGGVPPFGNIFGIPVIVDPSLFQHDSIVFNAGDRSFSIAMKSSDYRKVVDFEEINFAE